ncbi:MAG: hypothetical protein ACI9VR_004095 [Cognaticolwellia sp.]|jgi:hypothetical protein
MPLRTLRIPALAAVMALTACDRDQVYDQGTFSDNVYLAYQECREGEIRMLTSKHNIQTAFEPCGSNNFVSFAWAPDGVNLYFQLPMSAHIMNGETKEVVALPTEVPVAPVAWLSPELLVLPLSPPVGSTDPRLVLFDRVQANMNTVSLAGIQDPADLHSEGTRNTVLYTGLKDGKRQVYRASFDTSESERVFEWLGPDVENFTYSAQLQLIGVKSGDQVLVYQTDGSMLYRFDDASTIHFHPGGRYFALESLGEPISPFDQRTWNEVSEQAREREERRLAEWLEQQPDWVEKEVEPPVMDIFDVALDKRFRLGFVYGDRFQWYPAQDFYASFVLWGMEGKELNRNVALTQLHERVRMAANGELTMGVTERPFTPMEPSAPQVKTPKAEQPTPEQPKPAVEGAP